MIYTAKLNLKKPEATDYISPSPFNDNADILDDAMLASVYDPNGDGVVNEAIKATLDGNGNDITATYLPLTAGSSKKLTGNLYIDNANDVPEIIGYYQSNPYFDIFSNMSTLNIQALLNDGTVSTGLALGRTTGEVTLYANNKPISFRPQGHLIQSGEVQILTDGQITGGHPVIVKSIPNNISVAASATVNVLSVTGLNSSGYYVLLGQVQFTPSAATAGYIRASIGSSSSNIAGLQAETYTSSTATRHINVSAIISGYSSYYLNVISAVAGTVISPTTLHAIRIN